MVAGLVEGAAHIATIKAMSRRVAIEGFLPKRPHSSLENVPRLAV
jgi:hypothetical protein